MKHRVDWQVIWEGDDAQLGGVKGGRGLWELSISSLNIQGDCKQKAVQREDIVPQGTFS